MYYKLFPYSAQLIAKLADLKQALAHTYSAVRHMTSRCLGMLCKLHTTVTMEFILEHVIAMLELDASVPSRQGAMEALMCVVNALSVDVVPYIVLLIVPVLGRMSDQNAPVRLMASQCFATLIKLLPLEVRRKLNDNA